MTMDLTRNSVINAWVFRGLEHFFFVLNVPFLSEQKAFHLSMGLELLAKGYLIGERFSELDGLPPEQALLKMDKMARKFGHLGKIMDESRKFCCIIGKDKANKILAKDFGSFTGEGLLIGLAAAYFEGRYPVPRPVAYDFPDDGDPDIKWDPTLTPELEVLAHTIGRAILVSLRDDFNYSITERNLNLIIGGKQAKSFVNQFFKGDVSKYLRVTKPSG